jgi:hypothetical protein
MWGVLAATFSRYLPDHRDTLRLSFALSDAGHLEKLFATGGFRQIRVTRETRDTSFESFEEYWAPIEGAPAACRRRIERSPKRIAVQSARRCGHDWRSSSPTGDWK